MPATVTRLPVRERPNVLERLEDERLLAAMTEAEQLGLTVVESEEEAVSNVLAFVSPYLQQPLRTEGEARAQLNRPVPVHPIFAPLLAWWRGQ